MLMTSDPVAAAPALTSVSAEGADAHAASAIIISATTPFCTRAIIMEFSFMGSFGIDGSHQCRAVRDAWGESYGDAGAFDRCDTPTAEIGDAASARQEGMTRPPFRRA